MKLRTQHIIAADRRLSFKTEVIETLTAQPKYYKYKAMPALRLKAKKLATRCLDVYELEQMLQKYYLILK